MRPRGRSLAPLLVAAFVLSGCTGNNTGGPSATTTAPASPLPTVDQGNVKFRPGHYRYTFDGISASLDVDGSTATLEVKNATGAELAAPSIYVVTGDGGHVSADVTNPAAIPDGQTTDFRLAFPNTFKLVDAGLFVLSFGDLNVGAFDPVPI